MIYRDTFGMIRCPLFWEAGVGVLKLRKFVIGYHVYELENLEEQEYAIV